MDQKEFLARVLPAGNHYIAYPGDMKDQFGRIIWNHRSFTEPYQGVMMADQTANRSKDVYFAVASFKKAKVLDQRLGKEKSYRKQENVAELKSLFLDIDFKNYDSPEETVNALKDFLESSHIESPSIIVRTGGGLHVYWTFPAPLSREEWQPLADGLAGLAENLGLRADLQCTIDCARILRMPGTLNLKYDPPQLCEIVSSRTDDVDMAALTQRLHGVTSIRARTGRKSPNLKVDPAVAGMFSDSDSDDLGHGLEADYTIKEMAAPGGCPMIADMLIRGGDGDSRELWNNMILLTSFATDGRQFAHALSNQDPRYTAGETDAEFDAKLAEQGKGIGPTLCDTFSKCSSQCATCPHFGKIKTPLVLGKARPQAIPEPGPQPSYTRNGTTVIPCLRLVDKQPVPVEVQLVDMPMLGQPVLNRYPINGAPILEISFEHPVTKKVTRVVLDASRIKNREYLLGAFGLHAICITRDCEKPAEDAMGAWVNTLRNSGQQAPSSFGWMTVGDNSGFAVAGDLYTDKGEVRRIGIAPGYEKGFGTVGEIGPWKAMANMIIADERAELQIALATAFAAPLIHFTELSSTAVSIRSTMSGVGKTSVLRTARAVYGDPDFMSQASDTANYVEATLAAQTNMPWYWDEMRPGDQGQLSNAIYQILQGKSKGRSGSDGGAKATLRTRGMLVMASNLSLHEIMQSAGLGTDAGAYRILEVDIPARADRTSVEAFSRTMAKLKDNHGHAGMAYAAYLAKNQKQVQEIMDTVSERVNNEYAAIQAERYWVTTVKTILAGAIIARFAGICDFDVKRMNECLKRTIMAVRVTARTSVNGEEIAAKIFRAFPNQTLITDRFQWNKGGGRPKRVDTYQPVSGQYGHACIRLAVLDDTLAISADAIEEYARRYKVQAVMLTDQVRRISQKAYLAIDAGASAGAGSKTGRQNVYIMKASDILGVDEIQDWVSAVASRSGATPGSSSGSAPSGSTTP